MRKKLNPTKTSVDFQQVIRRHSFAGHDVVIINSVELNILIAGRKMRAVPYSNELFGFDGRGPEIHRFIQDRDLLEAGTFLDRRPLPGKICGVEYFWFEHPDVAWVIFQKMQVIQVVPEEVCSYWFMAHATEEKKGVGIYVIEDSAWLRSFNQRHLVSCRHFVLMFYDDIIEVIAEDLAFGRGAFRIGDHPEFSYYK